MFSEKNQYEKSLVYLPQPNRGVWDEELGKESRTGITVLYWSIGDLSGGDWPPGLSSGTAQASQAWNFLRGPCCTVAIEARLQRIRSPNQHGSDHPEICIASQAAIMLTRYPSWWPYLPPQQCGRSVVHRRLWSVLARYAWRVARIAETITYKEVYSQWMNRNGTNPMISS